MLKVKEVLTSSLLQPPQPLAANKPHCPPEVKSSTSSGPGANWKKKAPLRPIKAFTRRLKGRQMEAEGPITRNLCTDVKQLEWSQGPDSAVPVSHRSYSQSKVGTIPLFCLGPQSACVLVSYISR